MTKTARRILPGWCAFLLVILAPAAAQDMPKTTKELIHGTAKVTTSQMTGTVVQVDGSHLAVSMADGEIKTFNVPSSRRFLVGGKELTVGQLQPGTKLTATVTTTITPVTERTTTVGTARVWFVAGKTVILTLPNFENRQYTVDDSYHFVVDGREATVHELRRGMTLSAQRIVEDPRVDIVNDTVVTGEAPNSHR